jgi:hypothetical protein
MGTPISQIDTVASVQRTAPRTEIDISRYGAAFGGAHFADLRARAGERPVAELEWADREPLPGFALVDGWTT